MPGGRKTKKTLQHGQQHPCSLSVQSPSAKSPIRVASHFGSVQSLALPGFFQAASSVPRRHPRRRPSRLRSPRVSRLPSRGSKRRVGVRAPGASGAPPPKGCMHSSSEWFVAVAPALQAENLRCLFIELMVDEKLFQGRVGSLQNPAAGWGASATPPSSCLKPPPPSLSDFLRRSL